MAASRKHYKLSEVLALLEDSSDNDSSENECSDGDFLDETKDCTVCSDRKVPGQRKKTIYYCKTCSRKPGLHPKDCFEKYHTMRNYRE